MGFFEGVSAQWRNPSAIYRPAPFWSLNGNLQLDRLERQIDGMNEAGMGGFFIHSRYGLQTEYLGEQWFSCVDGCIKKAEKLGMKAYLYDEDRWPSGSAGGLITRDRKEYRMRYVVADSPDKCLEHKDRTEKKLARFAVTFDEKDQWRSYRQLAPSDEKGLSAGEKLVEFDVRFQAPRAWENDGTYIDTMYADAVDEFIHSTYDEYADRFESTFGRATAAIFTDEPNYGLAALNWFSAETEEIYRSHWTYGFEEQFKKRRGYDIVQFLPEIVLPAADPVFSKAGYDYYQTLTELFVENFTARIFGWCDRHNIKLTGHVLFEHELRMQVGAVGACMPHYEYMQWPGVDILGDQSRELLTAKQCSSVAAQLGKERVLSELYGGTGWDWPLEGHRYLAGWQLALGINFLCPHLSHYSLAGGGKRDYPASILDQCPWWPYYRTVEDYLSRISYMLCTGKPVREILVLHPIESIWGTHNYYLHQYRREGQPPDSIHEALLVLIWTLTRNNFDWDFCDESLLARYASIDGPNFRVEEMAYQVVVIPKVLTLRGSTVALLREFQKAGGRVVFTDGKDLQPILIDGEPDSTKIEELRQDADCLDGDANELIQYLRSNTPQRLRMEVDDGGKSFVWSMLEEIEDGLMLFLQSDNREDACTVSVNLAHVSGPVVLWDPLSSNLSEVPAGADKDGLKFTLEIPPSGTSLLTIGALIPDQHKKQRCVETPVCREVFSGPFNFQMTEDNTLPLDYCRFKMGSDPFSDYIPTLHADELVRSKFGLEPRLGRGHQPWYIEKSGMQKKESYTRVHIEYSFHVSQIPSRCKLVVENPEQYKITVNGKRTAEPSGYWIDEDFKTIDIALLLIPEENIVNLEGEYFANSGMEDIYLLGDFGITAVEPEHPLSPGNTAISGLPGQLEPGSWTDQGLPFYGAAVNYQVEVRKPEDGKRVRISLPEISCTAAAIHVDGQTFFLPWKPFSADITDAIKNDRTTVTIEVIGGRKNILGPLHVPWDKKEQTTLECFSPGHPDWTDEYALNSHGLTGPVVIELFEVR